MEKKLVVLGAGESGVGAALLGKKKGYEVWVSDSGKISPKYRKVLLNNKIDWEEGQHSEDWILDADVVVKSPGIADSVSIVRKIREKGIRMVSEIEFASWYTQAEIIAVTGSNGKTSVVKWIANILEEAGFSFVLAGNVGNSFAKAVAESSPEYYLLELSSFQLDGIEEFRPHIAVITNIVPDHLDRYEYDFRKYTESKFRIIKNQTKDDFFIYDGDDKAIKEALKVRKIQAKKVPFSFEKLSGLGTKTINNEMTTNLKNRTFNMSTKDLTLKGEHHAKNAMAASTVANLLKIRKQTIRESLERFQGVEHRLEHVLKVKNVQYINDSKATNINSTYYALKTVKPKTIWIVGGVDKGNNYEELLPLVNEKVKAIICLGLDNRKIIDSFDKCIDTILETKSMDEAVHMAEQLSEAGDTVLLSPACASFDLFENYEERGRKFKEVVRSL